MKVLVAVEKLLHVSGTVEVEIPDTAPGEDDNLQVGVAMVDSLIALSKLTTSDADWDAPKYVAWSFAATGAVDEVYVEHG